jgi:hypothetical protein
MSNIALEPILINFDDMISIYPIPELIDEKKVIVQQKKKEVEKIKSFYYCSSCNMTICLSTKYKHMKTKTHLRILNKSKLSDNNAFTISENKIMY